MRDNDGINDDCLYVMEPLFISPKDKRSSYTNQRHFISQRRHDASQSITSVFSCWRQWKNPCPWYCSVCKNINKRNTASIQYNSHSEWIHHSRCSGLNTLSRYSNTYIGNCCATPSSPASPHLHCKLHHGPTSKSWNLTAMASNSIVPGVVCEAKLALGSDHLPIIVEVVTLKQ